MFYCLWIAPCALQVIILILLARRGLYRKFPIFTAYTAFRVCEFVALFCVSRSVSLRTVYFQFYYLGLGISTALRFGIIGEIFADVFSMHGVLHNLKRPLIRWTTAAFLILAFSFVFYTQRSNADPSWFTVFVLDRSSNIVQCGLVLSLLVASRYLRLSWNRVVFGVALGFGVLCSLELAIAAIRSQVGSSAHLLLDLVDMGGYFSSVLIWLYYLITPERRPPSIPDNIPDVDLEAWNDELESLLTR